jgi:hypothetical protein
MGGRLLDGAWPPVCVSEVGPPSASRRQRNAASEANDTAGRRVSRVVRHLHRIGICRGHEC